jgi:alginate O-acetyltransferase complex protein AlgJ
VKQRLVIFLVAVLLSLLVVPVTNIILSVSDGDGVKWSERSFFYNMDFALRWSAMVLYPFGISLNPKQVIIGRDNWLYLGDQYEQTRSVDRRPQTSADIEWGRQIGEATEAWDVFLSSKGVKLFRIMIGPNKGTIYPEYLPRWAKPASPNVTDALVAGSGNRFYVDLRDPLLLAKENQTVPIYYKTDTHWNFLGAGIAFRVFAQQVSAAVPELRWPSSDTYEIKHVHPRAGGDLANFLRLSGSLSDLEPWIHGLDLPVETIHYDFDTRQVIHQGGNPLVESPNRPLLVKSVGALNDKRVLWLRDSFGTAISPLMAATFRQVVQLHWGEAIKPGGRLVQLVEDWKPDYVFFTVVERATRNNGFVAFPPTVFLEKETGFEVIRTSIPVASNHLTDGGSKHEYQIHGTDPFLDFSLSDEVSPSEVRYLQIELTCNDGTVSVPLQLFWLEDGHPYFDEEHSARFLFRSNQNLLDLRTLPKWKKASAIRRLRLDIDSQSACVNFKLSNPSLGIVGDNAGFNQKRTLF